jgi:hypothetical protein
MTSLWAVILLVLAAGCATAKGNALTLYQAQSQDLPILLLLGAAMLLAIYRPPAWRLPSQLPRWWVLLLIGFAGAALLAWGAYVVFGNYPLARDEHMVLFDMAVYAHGRLAMPLAPFWRPYAGALVPDFLLNSTMPSGLVSGYLPVNALMRLAFSKLADPVWLNPLLAVAGGGALLDVARRTFGPQDRAWWVVLLIYALSAQMLVNAMTPFSVTGHMALNLIWLAAFLRGGKLGHPIAILTGFLAVGLHQLVFHPFFVAPFLLWRLYEGGWRLVLLYTAAYAAIVLWWVYYPLLPPVQTSVAGATVVAGETHRDFINQTVVPLLLHRTPGTVGLMVLNLLRFFAWQNFALLPLLVAAVPVAIRERGPAAALLLGIVLWLIFVTLVLPYQGLGWGFRYLSPFLGSFALLAGFGYRELAQRIGNGADGLVLALSAVTAVAAIPPLLVTTHRFAEPYLALERLLAAQRTPFVIIDTAVSNPPDDSWALHPLDQVRNLPDLSNRPLRFSGNRVNVRLLLQLCDKGAVTPITRGDMHRVGFMPNVPERSPRFETMMAAVQQMRPGCLRKAT